MPNGKLGRRKVLKSIGTASLGGIVFSSHGVSALASERRAKKDRDIHKQSLKILEETDSPQKQREFLRDHGIGVASVHEVYSMPVANDSDDIGANSFPTRDLEILFRLYDKSDGYSAELAFQFEWDHNDTGSHPWDIACIGWEIDMWDYLNGDAYTDTYTNGPTTIGYRQNTGANGPGFNVDDANQSGGTSAWYYCGVDIAPSGSEPPVDREVHASYTHTWKNVTFTGIGVGPKSVTVNIEESTGKWTTQKERDGTFLTIEQTEA